MSRLHHERVEFSAAAAFVAEHHRHHTPPVGHLFSLGAFMGDDMVGVAIVGRPVARHRDDGLTAEITRLCIREGVRNAASFLLGRCAKAALALGYRRIGTYTLARESGASLRAAGWVVVGQVAGRSWDTPSRRRTDKHPTEDKQLWELSAMTNTNTQPEEPGHTGGHTPGPMRDALAAEIYPVEWARAITLTGQKARNYRARLRRSAEHETAMRPLRAAGRSCAGCSSFSRNRRGDTICEAESDFAGDVIARPDGLCPMWSAKS